MKSTNTIALRSYDFHTSDSIHARDRLWTKIGKVKLDHLKNKFLSETLYKFGGPTMLICLCISVVNCIGFYRYIEHQELLMHMEKKKLAAAV